MVKKGIAFTRTHGVDKGWAEVSTKTGSFIDHDLALAFLQGPRRHGQGPGLLNGTHENRTQVARATTAHRAMALGSGTLYVVLTQRPCCWPVGPR